MASGRFSKEFIERVRDGNPISDVIGEYIPILKKQGDRHWACCPFHSEKTPSFSISPEKGLFHCFGCKESGDVFAFVEKYERCTFPEAVEKLAERAHLPIPAEEMSEEERRRERYREELYEACDLATAYFHNCLIQTRMGKEGLEYWKRRGISAQTIVDFKLGMAPPEWDRLYRDFRKRGISDKILADAGLCIQRNGRCYDRFRHRIIFPIRDIKGRTVAFGGRIMTSNTDGAKYLNSPETLIFNKSKTLFALERATAEIRKQGVVVLVEGYMDAVSVHNQGITNVVASLGTAFTEDQARLLKRWAKEVVVAYDMDRAGREATRRAIEIANEEDLRLRVVTIPDGKDPDEYIRLHGVEGWNEVVQLAQNVLDYRMDEAIGRYDITTIEGKNSVLAEMLPIIIETDNAVIVDSYLRQLAKRIRVDEAVVRSEATKLARQKQSSVYVVPVSGGYQDGRDGNGEGLRQRRMEERLLRYLIDMGPETAMIIETLEETDWQDPLCRQVFLQIKPVLMTGERLQLYDVIAALDAEEQARLSRIMMEEMVVVDSAYTVYVRPLRKAALQREYTMRSENAENLMREGDQDGWQREMRRAVQLQREIRQWE